MKKIIALAMALALLFTAALAEDLSSLSDTDLMELYRKVGEEGEQRGVREAQDIQERIRSFFSCWFSDNMEGMLNLCSSEWLAPLESAEAALRGILGNRKPLNFTPGEVSGKYGDEFRTASCLVIVDNNDGRGPRDVEFRIEMIREEDGSWYLDPSGLEESVKDRDLTALSREELAELDANIREEVEKRSRPVDTEVTNRLTWFFRFWSDRDMESMLELCSTEWKNTCADPRLELFRILANRTPLIFEISDMNGDLTDTSRILTVRAKIDRQNGREPQMYLFQITMVREGDGEWYADPRGLNAALNADDELKVPEATPAPDAGPAGMVLYYVPEGGEKYHLDPECPAVHEKFKPIQGTFLYRELNEEPYRALVPCPVCGAPERPE